LSYFGGKLKLFLSGELRHIVAQTQPYERLFLNRLRDDAGWWIAASAATGLAAGVSLARGLDVWTGTVLVICVLQYVLIAFLLIDRASRRREDLEVRDQRQELAHLSRVATLGELSGALAHELNQPLTAILSNAQAAQRFLRKKPLDEKELGATLSDIVEADKRAVGLIGRVRTLLKKEDADFRPLNLNDVVKETIHLAHSEFLERRVSVDPGWAREMPAIIGDRVQLQQVFLNLLLNACDAMEGNDPGDRVLAIKTFVDPGGFVRVEVTDRGVGIPPQHLDRVFEPFFSSKDQGLGLGLAISRSIVTSHGGRLSVANNAERGATFFVRLPVPARQSGWARPAESVSVGTRSHSDPVARRVQ
jgi:C4-dicarboxylate-specific signal transduction histidine kinase